MAREKIIKVKLPVLNGSVSSYYNKCGHSNCACRDEKNPQLHGPFYRWTGKINGKSTSRIISKEVYKECEIRIENYRNAVKKINKIALKALDSPPWK